MVCNTKVLIVGINGFLGKELAKLLERKGVKVFGTTHTSNISENIFQLTIGGVINKKILLNDFSSVIYLSHSASIDSESLIKWYNKIFVKFKELKVKQIYISSYSAHENAESNYGKSKYQIERLFVDNGEYSISPGLIIGNGGIFSKISSFVVKSPVVVIPTASKENLIPVVSVENICSVIFSMIEKDFIRKNYNIFSHMVKLEDIIRLIVQVKKEKILFVMRLFESIGIKLPVSSDSLIGFITNQKYSVKPDILECCSDIDVDSMIKKVV